MSDLINDVNIVNDASEDDKEEDDEVNKFLAPYRKIISDNEELQAMKIKTSLRQQKETLDQINAFQKEVEEIDRQTLERRKVITNNASLIKRMLQERNDDTDRIPVGHEYQAQLISVVEGLVDFTNNFPQMMNIISQTPATDGTEILAPLKDAIKQFEFAVTKAENSMETIIQCKDHLESMANDADETMHTLN